MNLGGAAALAALPIVTVLVLMLLVRWSAARAGAGGVAVALAVAWWTFGFGRTTYEQIGPIGAALGALAEAAFTAATILWIVFPALCIHQQQSRTGALTLLQEWLQRLSSERGVIALIIAWFFALFLEGAAGFGTPVALAAPLLAGIGFRRVDAVAIALLGHSVGVSFGAVGTPILPQIAATGFGGLELARATAFYHGLLGWVMLLFVATVVRDAADDARGSLRAIGGWIALAAVLFLLPFWAFARWVGPELPTLGGAVVGGLGFVAALRLAHGRTASGALPPAHPAGRGAGLASAAAPYVALVALVLLTRLVPPVKQALTEVTWRWSLVDTFHGSFQPLYHPGSMLFAAFLLGALQQRVPPVELKTIALRAARPLGRVALALVAMLGLSRVLLHAGMIDTLAQAAAVSGPAWPGLSPFIGVLGTFVTGSATASNILFTDFQQATAQRLGLPVLSMVGAQGFGAAVGNVISPHNIIAGSATVELGGREGEILRRTLLPCLIYAALGGLAAIAAARSP
jgi:lactate permease